MRSHPLFAAYLAFASVCFFWGTTYLGIRIGLESLPPLVLISVRFLLSGTLVLTGSLLFRRPFPDRRTLVRTAGFGILVLGVGNSCLTYAQQHISSSLAALFISISPLWMVGLEAALPGGDKLRAGTVAGMLVGMAGAGILVAPDALRQGLSGSVVTGFLILQLGSFGWCLGSILQKRFHTAIDPVVSAGVQQLTAGLFFLPPMLMDTHPYTWTARGLGALVYLAIFGSIVGYTSYIIALQRLPIAIVSLYTYVNPVVAAVLGWLIFRERFGAREITAMAIVFLGVAIVKTAQRRVAGATV